MVCWFCFSRRCCFVCLFTTCHCQAALSILHVRSFLGGILLALKIVNLLFPSASWSFPLSEFSTQVAIFVVVSFQ